MPGTHAAAPSLPVGPFPADECPAEFPTSRAGDTRRQRLDRPALPPRSPGDIAHYFQVAPARGMTRNGQRRTYRGGTPAGAYSVQQCTGFEREWRERGRATDFSIDSPPLQAAALSFVSYGHALVRTCAATQGVLEVNRPLRPHMTYSAQRPAPRHRRWRRAWGPFSGRFAGPRIGRGQGTCLRSPRTAGTRGGAGL